jgi:hypothetical protein
VEAVREIELNDPPLRLSLVDGEEVVAVSQMVSDVENDVLSEEERNDNSNSLLLMLVLAVASLRPHRRIRSSETR